MFEIHRFTPSDADQKFVYLVARPAEPGQRLAMKAHLEGQHIWKNIEEKFVSHIPHHGFRTAAQNLLATIHGYFDLLVDECAMLGLTFGLAHMGIMVDGKYYHLKRETGEREGHIALDIKPFPPNSIISGYPIWKTNRTHEERGRLALYALAVMRMKWDLESIPVYDGDHLLEHHDFLRDDSSSAPSQGRWKFDSISHNCQDFVCLFIALVMLPTLKGVVGWIGTAREMIRLHESGDLKRRVFHGPVMQKYLDKTISKEEICKIVLHGEMSA